MASIRRGGALVRHLALPVLPLLLLLPAGSAAQAPGYQQLDNRQILAEYHAEVLSHLNALMQEWSRAWSADEPAALAELYTENAVLIRPDAAPLRGRGSIAGHFQSALPAEGSMEAFMLDFDASGSMAVVYGNFLLEMPSGERRTGSVVTVYRRDGRRWRIRTQVFREN